MAFFGRFCGQAAQPQVVPAAPRPDGPGPQRRRRGLLTLTDVTIPVERVQAVVLGTGAIRARRGWHDLRLVSLATESAKESHHMVAPLAQLDEIWPIAREAGLMPPASDLTFARPHFGPWFDRAVLFSVPFVGGAALGVASGIPGAGLLVLPPLVVFAGARLAWRSTSHASDAGQL